MPLHTIETGIALPKYVGNDGYTILLLHCDGSDASTTFTDSSASARSFTAAGNAQIDTAQSKFGGASGLFDGTGDYIETADSTDFDMGTDDWTIDFWVKRNETGTSQRNLFGQGNATLSSNYQYGRLMTTTSNFAFAMNNDTYTAQTASGITDTSWHHIACIRDTNDLVVALDGVLGTPVDITSVSWSAVGGKFAVGRLGELAAGSHHNGWIDEFRWSAGIARWTANFTPPIRAYGP